MCHMLFGDIALKQQFISLIEFILGFFMDNPRMKSYNKKPNLGNLKVFGSLAYVTTLSHKDKFSPRSTLCVFLGYSLTQKRLLLL